MDSGYWQVVEKRGGTLKTGFPHPEKKRRWKVMHIGVLNKAPKFVAMMMKVKNGMEYII